MDPKEYIPGVCNIGVEEIARRRNLGWSALITTLGLLAVLVWIGVNPYWRLFVFFPAMLSASGFLQAYFQFCSGFARQGVSNLSSLGQRQTITDESSKKKDRRKGDHIILYAVLIGAAVAIISVTVL